MGKFGNSKKKRDKAEKMIEKFTIPEHVTKEQLISQIISLDFNEEKIKQWIADQIKQIPPDDDPEMKRLLELFDLEYSVLSILEEDEVKEKIKELNYQEDKIREWIEEKMSE